MVSSGLFWALGCLECLDLHLGGLVALPLPMPRHAVHPAPGPSVGDAQILGAAQCRTERQSLQLPSAVQKGRLKVEEDDEQATLGQVLGGLLEAVDGEGIDEETWLVVCHCSTALDGDVSWLVEFTLNAFCQSNRI